MARDPGQLRRAALAMAAPGVPRPAAEAMLVHGGWPFAARADDGAARREAAALLDALIARGLPMIGGRVDPGLMVNLLVADGLAGAAPAWRDRWVASGRRLVGALAGDGNARPDCARLPPRRFRIAFRRTFGLHGIARGTALRLNLPLPHEDAQLSGLEVRPVTPGLSRQPGRLQCRYVREEETEVAVEAVYAFTCHAGLPHDDEGVRPPDPTRAPPAIRALAASLAGEETDAARLLARFRDHLLDAFAVGVLPGDRAPLSARIERALADSWVDCRVGAALLVALCHARGIPARLVGGWLLWAAPTEHWWLEAWIDGRGWTPFDLLAWDLSAGGADPAWRGIYAGAIDYRMKTQVLPDRFTGPPGVPMPPAWHRLSRLVPGGSETRMVSAVDGRLIYADRVTHLPA